MSPAIVAEQASTDWIECDGAGCPVSDVARVKVQFRFDRDRRAAERANPSDGIPAYIFRDCWVHQGALSDIVACQVVA
jgi:uncharacterized protein involved in type VI secretion and phage assembly